MYVKKEAFHKMFADYGEAKDLIFIGEDIVEELKEMHSKI
jgi:hypothetical protein